MASTTTPLIHDQRTRPANPSPATRVGPGPRHPAVSVPLTGPDGAHGNAVKNGDQAEQDVAHQLRTLGLRAICKPRVGHALPNGVVPRPDLATFIPRHPAVATIRMQETGRYATSDQPVAVNCLIEVKFQRSRGSVIEKITHEIDTYGTLSRAVGMPVILVHDLGATVGPEQLFNWRAKGKLNGVAVLDVAELTRERLETVMDTFVQDVKAQPSPQRLRHLAAMIVAEPAVWGWVKDAVEAELTAQDLAQQVLPLPE